jgi:hypothetical protein
MGEEANMVKRSVNKMSIRADTLSIHRNSMRAKFPWPI